MPSKWTVLPILVGLLLTCLIAAGLYGLRYGSYLDQMIFKRSLRENKTAPLTINFPSNYHSTGRLFLPHSNIVEPFEIWFTKDFNRSRIDYYYGTDKTYQRADLGKYGVTFKVVPMHTEKDGNYIGCWNLEGHEGWPIIPQPIVPDMSHFKYAGEEVYMGTPATRWEYRYMVFGLLNAHTLLVSKLDPVRPVRYEMKGYDSLMASYYDKYVLEYISFEDWKPDLEKFELPKDQWCYNWSHSIDSHFVSNPMHEFMSYGEDIVEEMYHMYKHHHEKVHNSRHEHVKRKHIFRHNMRYIRSINRKNLTYKLAPNHLVDLTDEEYDRHAGLSEDNSTNHKGGVHLEDHHEAYSNMSVVLKTVEVPDELDWREYGAVTPVRGQGICGSCYALGAVGAVEGAYFMKTGRLLELSAQQVVDCSWGSGNHGCRGGWYNKALSWIYMNGVAEAKNYGPYLAQEGTCETLRIKERIKIDAFAFVPKYNNSALKRAIAKYGPACVTINQKPLSLKFYSWGIYDNPECDGSSTRHTVLVVGYGKENGVPYWLIKNSWSSSWGLDGYIKLAWKDNICGVTKNPVVALFKKTSFQFPVKEKIDHVNPSEPDSMGRKVHPRHRPGFRGNINGSRFHGKANSGSLNNSGLSKINVGGKSDEHLHGKANKTNKNLNNVPGKTRADTFPANKVSLSRTGNPSEAFTRTNAFNSPKVNKTKDNMVDKSAAVRAETIADPDTQKDVKNSDKTVAPFSKDNNEHGQIESKSSDKKDKKVNSHVKKLESQREVESQEKVVEANNLPSNELVAPEYNNPNKNTEEPSSKDTFKNFAADVYEHGQNLGMYNIQGSNEITTGRNSVYNIPEKTEHVAEWNQGSQSFEPDYYYPSYNYDIYKAYPSEYETPEGVFAPVAAGINHPYEENFAEGTNLNQWLPNEQLTSEGFDAVSESSFNSAMQDFPLLGSPQKQQEQLNEKKEDSFAARIKATTPTPRITTAAAANTGKKASLTRTIETKPRIASKPVRHYSGKLQDIYDKLEEVIASSLKKNKRPRKTNVIRGY